jgi:polysaccharide biosynthesis/export protein
MMKKNYILLTLFFIFAMTSCYNYQSIGLMQEHNPYLPKYQKSAYEQYKIQINDEIVFRLMTSDETISKLISNNNMVGAGQYQISYRVYTDGTIDIPFVKAIPVAGLTISEAEKIVEKRFKDIIPDANVRIALANKTFTVIGEAGTGVFPIVREKMTIYQALSISGSLNNTGNFKHVKILRQSETGMKVLDFDIRTSTVIESKYYYVYPNDIIYVSTASSSFYKVSSWSSFIGLITSSFSLLITVLYYNR